LQLVFEAAARVGIQVGIVIGIDCDLPFVKLLSSPKKKGKQET